MNAPERVAARADFSGVSYAEAIERAESLIPVLRERAARCDEAGELLPENAAELNRTGLARILQPKRWGGMELPFQAIFDIPEIVARGCISTAWNLSNLLAHHWMLAMYEEQAQA